MNNIHLFICFYLTKAVIRIYTIKMRATSLVFCSKRKYSRVLETNILPQAT